MIHRVLATSVMLFAVAFARADVSLPNLFGDHMVLQRGTNLPIWGSAEPNEQVTVTIAGQTKPTNADENGRWRVTLDPIDTSEPLTMTISGKNTITISDILIGEVWVCSGQSNMEWPISRSRDPEQEAAAADYPKIRLFNVSAKKSPSREPASDVDAKWQRCSPETAEGFSAVAYFFGRHLHKELNVPIGLINVSWGGMPAEAFTDPASLKSDPAFQSIADAHAAAIEKYPQAKEEFARKLADWEFSRKEAEKNGEKVPARPREPYGPDSPNVPSALWNGMIHPIIPFAMRGAIWYQGESNAGSIERAVQYRKLLPAMISGWRKAWGQGNFPFLIVQLANFRDPATQPAEPESAWAMIREAQAMTLDSSPNTGLAVIIDIGEAKDIHPKNKQDVGKRLALAAEKIAYGRDVVYAGPTYKSMKVDGNKAILEFDHVGGGLVAGDGKLEGFAIRGADGVWHSGNASIEDARVIVTSPQVSGPVAVRYAWATNPRATLYNKEGLPAAPFRTDRE